MIMKKWEINGSFVSKPEHKLMRQQYIQQSAIYTHYSNQNFSVLYLFIPKQNKYEPS